MTEYIVQDKLANTLCSHRNTPEIRVLTGIRRCGRSTLLEHYVQSLFGSGVPASSISTRRFDSFDTPIGYSATDLYANLMQVAQEAQPGLFYVFPDGIQNAPGWEGVARRLYSRDDADVYITGSNVRLLSGELATCLMGCYITIPVYPLFFDKHQHHHRAQGTTDSTDQLFSRYMVSGGMPGLLVTGQPDQDGATEVLASIYESIVLKGVAGRYGICDIVTLEKLSRYLLSTPGSLFSVNNVANTLVGVGANASYATVGSQISTFERSLAVYSTQQERMRGEEPPCPQRKFYSVDSGSRNLATGSNGSGRGAQLEDIAFMELQRRGYDVVIGSLPDGEIDFIVKHGGNKQYIRATPNMIEEQTRERELAPLRQSGNAFPRTVPTFDQHGEGMTDEGIHITSVMDWFCLQEHVGYDNALRGCSQSGG